MGQINESLMEKMSGMQRRYNVLSEYHKIKQHLNENEKLAILDLIQSELEEDTTLAQEIVIDISNKINKK
jgi:hypothetical protein